MYLFVYFQIKEEFNRLTTISLEQKFMFNLDKYTPKLIGLMEAKGGTIGRKLKPIVQKLRQVGLVKIICDYYLCFFLWCTVKVGHDQIL